MRCISIQTASNYLVLLSFRKPHHQWSNQQCALVSNAPLKGDRVECRCILKVKVAHNLCHEQSNLLVSQILAQTGILADSKRDEGSRVVTEVLWSLFIDPPFGYELVWFGKMSCVTGYRHRVHAHLSIARNKLLVDQDAFFGSTALHAIWCRWPETQALVDDAFQIWCSIWR